MNTHPGLLLVFTKLPKAGAYPSEAPFEMLNKIYQNMIETAYLGENVKNALPKIAQ